MFAQKRRDVKIYKYNKKLREFNERSLFKIFILK